MDIEQWDSTLRWRMTSHSRKHIHYVADLGTWECQCEDWTCRKSKKYKETGSRQHMCKHLRLALETFWSIFCVDRFKNVPVMRKLSGKMLKANRYTFALAFVDELVELEK